MFRIYKILPSKAPSMLVILVGMFFALCLFGCDKNKAQIAGTITLVNDSGNSSHDPIDYGGVTVALYMPTKLDTTLVRLNGKYPQIGVKINQDTEFDHRTADPLKIIQTEADGSFTFKELDSGTYNMVLLSPEWGVKYVCDIMLSNKERKNLGSLELYPIKKYSSFHNEDIVFKSDHTYLIEETVLLTGNVEIEARARIYLDPGCAFKVYGDFSTQMDNDSKDFWRMLPSRGIFNAERISFGPSEHFNSLELRGDNVGLHGGVVRYMDNTIGIFNNHCEVSNMMISDSNSGLSIPQGSATIKNVVTKNCVNMGFQVQNLSNQDIEISKNIFISHGYAISLSTLGEFNINNNYFYNSKFAIATYVSVGVVTHNEFDKNEFDVHQGQGYIDVNYNKFYHTRRWTIRPLRRMVANNNDFYKTNVLFIVLRTDSPPLYTYVDEDFDARNNYWKPQNLDPYIADANDNHLHPGQECPHYVIYTPRRSSPVPGAGIQ